MKDGPIVSLVKMMLIMSTFTVLNFESNQEGQPLYWLKITETSS
jgi:hypothetical protein